MKPTESEKRGAFAWFVIGGALAVVFAFTLFTIDERLTNSTHEQELGQTLRELRTAQFSVSSDQAKDERLLSDKGQ